MHRALAGDLGDLGGQFLADLAVDRNDAGEAVDLGLDRRIGSGDAVSDVDLLVADVDLDAAFLLGDLGWRL